MADNSTDTAAIQPYAKNETEKNRFILKQLVTKDFKLKYRRSVLGVVWSVLNPLLMMVVMSIVFSFLFSNGIENFPLYLILGNITFSFMSDSTSAALTSFLDAAPLLKKVKISRFVFPVQKVLVALVNFAFSLVAVALVMLWFRGSSPLGTSSGCPCAWVSSSSSASASASSSARSPCSSATSSTCGASSSPHGPTSRPCSGTSSCSSTRVPPCGLSASSRRTPCTAL